MSFENGVFVPPDNLENIDFGLRRSQRGGLAASNGRNNEQGFGGSGNPGNQVNQGPRRGGGGNRNRDKYLQKKRDYQHGSWDETNDTNTTQSYFPEESSRSANARGSRQQQQRLPGLMTLNHGLGESGSASAATTSSSTYRATFNPDAAEFLPSGFVLSETHESWPVSKQTDGKKNRNHNQNIGRAQQREDFRFRRRFPQQQPEYDRGGAGGSLEQGGYGYYNTNPDETAEVDDIIPPRGSDWRDKEKWSNRRQRDRDDINYSNGNPRGRYGNGTGGGGGALNSPKRTSKFRERGEGKDFCNDQPGIAVNLQREGAGAFVLEKVFESKYQDRVRSKQKPDIRNQRETLCDQLSRNAYDCMICVEKVKRSQQIWTCSKCYNVFHLNCLCKWASSSKDEVGWRCPGCQSYFEEIPTEYRCFCGSMKNPCGFQSEVPHTCSGHCGRKGAGGVNCTHACPIRCHPGPCPPCEAMDSRNCCCGKTSAHVKCSSKAVITCGGKCELLLNCQKHRCEKNCHAGDCNECSVISKLGCFCGAETKELICDAENAGTTVYSCAKPCGKLLNCKKHKCETPCHAGLCPPCKTSPEAVLSCPCGQTPVAEACMKCKIPLRKSCTDPIPICGKVCGKILSCGEPGKNHKCGHQCHVSSQCPTCPLLTAIKCRCGSKSFDIPCEKYDPAADVTCEKKCQKRRSCAKHKCNAKCCIDADHICPVPCNKPLRCGNHRCSFLCHNGNCAGCRVVSFEELACECGTSVIYPPVACGTKPPHCQQPCTREHECDHPVVHNCHSETECPPCTFFTEKWCHGKHELRKNVMCHIKQLSCGMPCGKLLPCVRHCCSRRCHPDICQTPNESCKKPCDILRKDCGHPCGSPCHENICPESKCKLTVEALCPCGRKKESMICWKREKEYNLLITYLTNIQLKKLRDVDPTVQEEKEINEKEVLETVKEKSPKTNVLECDKECLRMERNRKMIQALQIEDPDATSTFGTPNYSEFLIGFAKKNPQFLENVHDRLTALVVKAKRSKKKNETYGFESMNRDKRKVVHEYSDHFGCLSESFDEEPNRNVVCTASKDKSYLPAVSLVDAVFRPNICSERKNAFNDVEIFQNSKSQILRPANGKMWGSSSTSVSKMVPLAGATTSTLAPSTTSSTYSSASTSASQVQTIGSSVFSGDFPPLG